MLNLDACAPIEATPDEALPRGVAFSGALSADRKRTLDELAVLIREQDAILRPPRAKSRAPVFAIGAALLKAKGLVPHGQFRHWLEDEFKWPQRTAQYCMRIKQVLDHKAETVSCLTLRALIALAADTTPEATRAAILKELDGGADLKSRDVLGRIEAARGETSTDPRARKLQHARMAAAFLRARLSSEAMLTLMAYLGNADVKAFVAAVTGPDATKGEARCVDDDRCLEV